MKVNQDKWAIKAQREGYRTRAVYKLEEILRSQNYKIHNSYSVFDIGAAPGGWSHYLKKKFPKLQISAIDILPIEPIEGVDFYQEDIRNIELIDQIRQKIGSFDLVISDLAPNLSGIRDVDEENIYELNLITLQAAIKLLGKESHTKFIIKTFQNGYLKKFRQDMGMYFQNIMTCKPAASKSKSGEIYLLGENLL
ncbi:MAG: RlmE family RNA methyltransferase [Gammaproteobacteria bacterium]